VTSPTKENATHYYRADTFEFAQIDK